MNRVLTGYPTGGYINIFWDRAFNSLVPSAPRNSARHLRLLRVSMSSEPPAPLAPTSATCTSRTTGAFIPRLTLNLGFRFEKETVPSFQRSVQDTAFASGGVKFAPRLGASFDVFGDGRMKIYGSWGRYYDWVKYELARGTFGGDYWRVQLLRAGYAERLQPEPDQSSRRRSVEPRSARHSFRDRRVPGFDTIDPQIKPMGSDNINAGTEFRVGPQMVFRASWVHNNLIRTIEDLGVLVNGNEEYYYANPGEGGALQTPTSGATKPFPTPKAKRTYDAAEFQLTKRFGSWFGLGQLRVQPSLRQLRGLGESSDRDHRRLILSNADIPKWTCVNKRSIGRHRLLLNSGLESAAFFRSLQ